MAYVRSHQTDARIVRIFNTYGPNSDPFDGRLVPNFITQALAGAPLTVYGDGRQTRSLCFVSDLVDGLVSAMESEKATGEIINLGNPEEHDVTAYAHLIVELVGSKSVLVARPVAVGDDPQRRRPDISKAKSLLGWQPIVGLEDGLSRTIAYFRTALAKEPPSPSATLVTVPTLFVRSTSARPAEPTLSPAQGVTR